MKYVRMTLLIAIACLTVFIWSNSVKPQSESAEQSGRLAEWIEQLLTNNGTQPLTAAGAWILEKLRKIAHFAEFMGLSMLLSAYKLTFPGKEKMGVLLYAPAVAIVDETIQIFSDRGPAVSDVLLDCCGAAAGMVFVLLMAAMIGTIRRRIR